MVPQSPLPITLCLTIGGRPDHLQRTLASLPDSGRFAAVIAVNDFGDEASNTVFRAAFPSGQLIVPGCHLGHHRAVDQLYQRVQTPYVFHCEDDWLFVRSLDWWQVIKLLERNAEISQVCLRDVEDFGMPDAERQQVRIVEDGEISYLRLDQAEPKWHGYTFNPHLAPLKLWRDLGGFSRFRAEWNLSNTLRRRGRFVAYLPSGLCFHIGADRSMVAAVQSRRRALWLPGWLGRRSFRVAVHRPGGPGASRSPLAWTAEDQARLVPSGAGR